MNELYETMEHYLSSLYVQMGSVFDTISPTLMNIAAVLGLLVLYVALEFFFELLDKKA